jgi:hypothetical protein
VRRIAPTEQMSVIEDSAHRHDDLRETESMGYKLAIVPGLLIKFVVGICEQKLAELKALYRHPKPPNEMTVREVFRRVGADEWDARLTQFRTGATIRSAAE